MTAVDDDITYGAESCRRAGQLCGCININHVSAPDSNGQVTYMQTFWNVYCTPPPTF